MDTESLARDVREMLDRVRQDAKRYERLIAARSLDQWLEVGCHPDWMIESFRGWLSSLEWAELGIHDLEQHGRYEHLMAIAVVKREVREGLSLCEDLKSAGGNNFADPLHRAILATVGHVRDNDKRLAAVQDVYNVVESLASREKVPRMAVAIAPTSNPLGSETKQTPPDGPVEPLKFLLAGIEIQLTEGERRFWRVLRMMWDGGKFRRTLRLEDFMLMWQDKWKGKIGTATALNYIRETEVLVAKWEGLAHTVRHIDGCVVWVPKKDRNS